MRTIYHQVFNQPILGEAEAFYEIKDKELIYLSGWFLNDAHYRSEYMNSLFEALDIEVEDLPAKYKTKAAKLMQDEYGL